MLTKIFYHIFVNLLAMDMCNYIAKEIEDFILVWKSR